MSATLANEAHTPTALPPATGLELPQITKHPTRQQRWYHRLAAFVFGGRVSEIHLQEARERYLTLARIVEYYESTYCEDSNKTEECIAIRSCKRTLDNAEEFLTRRQEDLNYLWRELTRVRIILFEKIIEPERLPYQLDFCREEAHRLAVGNDPEVSEMLQKLAEATDEHGQNKERMKRVLRALIERFNTTRTARIYQQFQTIRTYKIAFLSLLVLSVLILASEQLLVDDNVRSNFQGVLAHAQPNVTDTPGSTLLTWLAYPFDLVQERLLVFVFLGGLIGGFFSVVIRIRDRQMVPGEDVYFRWYVLSKPFVGALGAVILFVLFEGDFVSLELVKDIDQWTPPKIFGFAFLAGFSERLVLPELR